MPLKQPPLSATEIATIERWVREGAKFDGGNEATTTLASLVDPLKNLPTVALKTATSDPVTFATFSTDGSKLAASIGRTVVVYDVASGKPASELPNHPGQVNFVAFLPNGTSLVTAGGRAGQFGFVNVWDIASKARKLDLRGHTDAILSATLSPDGKTLATASYDRMIKLWDLTQGREAATLKEHTDAVHCVAFSPDGKRLASGGADRTVKVWDIATGKRIASFADATGEVYSVAFAKDGATVFAGGVDRSIRAWELKGQGGTFIRSVFAHDAPILRLAVTADGTRIVSTGEDKSVKTWGLPNMAPIANLGTQSDWPQALAISPNGKQLAIGRYDGSLSLIDATTGKLALALRDVPKPATAAKPAPKSELSRNPNLNPPSPRAVMRGKTTHMTLTGSEIAASSGVYVDDPAVHVKIVAPAKPDVNRLELEMTVDANTRIGTHQIYVQTPLGTPAPKPFVVSEDADLAEAEPNDTPTKFTAIKLPATLTGTIDRPGDIDGFRFDAQPGEALVFEYAARELGSTLDPILSLRDSSGRTLTRVLATPSDPDPLITWTVPTSASGPFSLVVEDAQFGGDGNHFYRINSGKLPFVTAAFPRSIERGKSAAVKLVGVNIAPSITLDAKQSGAGAILSAHSSEISNRWPRSRETVVALEGPQTIETTDISDQPQKAASVSNPGGASGRIDHDGDSDVFKFVAKKGKRQIIEVFGRRLGSPIDSVIEIIDAQGRPVPRAVLRPVEETNVAFRDHASTSRAIRLTKWDDLGMGDYLLVGRELMRLAALPRNPDDDAVFWGLGNERSDSGERVAFLETTPEHHPLAQPMLKVEIHPPGSKFPEGGIAPVTLGYRNDDGGPGFGKDSRITFDPPADGTYFVRVEDVRGLGGADYSYAVAIRDARPDFNVALSTSDPNIPRGGAMFVRVDINRIDGFNDPVEVSLEGLPPGITATTTRIDRDAYTADLLLSASPSAAQFNAPGWRVKARSIPQSSGESAITHESVPGGQRGGRITVTSTPDLEVSISPTPVRIRAGERVEIRLDVKRGAAFSGRVPIDVRNLPFGVRVLHIGLNGVLVTEKEAGRSIFLYAEPWVAPMERPIFAVGRVEATGVSSSSPAVQLIIEPAKSTPVGLR